MMINKKLIELNKMVRFIASSAVILFAGQAMAGQRYIVTVKTKAAYNQIKNLSQVESTQTQRPGFFSVNPSKVKALDSTQMFIVESDKDLEFLKRNPHIADVEKEVMFPAPQQISTHATVNRDFTSEARDQSLGTPWGVSAVNAPEAWETTRGKGIKVLVIDTGIDRTHPALVDSFVKGKNFLERAPFEKAPYDYFDDVGHGSHVAGTAIASGSNGGLIGVAPEAELYVARVCGFVGCSPLAIIEAINWGIDQGVDVMNLSLGGGNISRAEIMAFARAEFKGVTVVAATGNDAPRTEGISYPSRLDTVIAVGATAPNQTRAPFSQFGEGLFIMAPGMSIISSIPVGSGRLSQVQIEFRGEKIEVPSMALQGSSSLGAPVEGDLVYVGLGKKADFLGVDLTGKIAIIQRGEITMEDKVRGAMAAGAKGVIIANGGRFPESGALTEDGSEIGVPAVLIGAQAGQSIIGALLSGEVSFKTTVSVVRTDYVELFGTSMASPHVAGAAALILGANPNLTPAQVRTIIAETAVDKENKLEYGNGLIDAQAAVVKALVTVGDQLLMSVAAQ